MLCTENLPRQGRATSAPASRRENNDEIDAVVQIALAGKQNARGLRERRRQHRTPYPYLIKLVPLAADCETPASEGIVVVGKHLSAGGVDFYHRDPLPFRWAKIWLDTGGRTTQPVLVELLWCRFNKQGWYENGGRFVRLLDQQQDRS